MVKFSVCMSVYKNDSPSFFEQAIDSVVRQSVCPDEVLLIIDGPIPDALRQKVLDKQKEFPVIRLVFLPENKGLGNALKVAVENVKYDVIARMDSDDLSLPDRFEKQLSFLEENPDVDIVGGQMVEFIDTPDNIIGQRVVPLSHDDIYNYMKSRCAFNHVTVMFKKEAVISVGNYQDWFWNEDYYLWVRMMLHGCKFANLPDVLVNVRSGIGQYARRGSMKYFKSEEGIQRYMLQHHLTSLPRYLYNVTGRFVIQVLMPNWLRGFVFRTFFRKKFVCG